MKYLINNIKEAAKQQCWKKFKNYEDMKLEAKHCSGFILKLLAYLSLNIIIDCVIWKSVYFEIYINIYIFNVYVMQFVLLFSWRGDHLPVC